MALNFYTPASGSGASSYGSTLSVSAGSTILILGTFDAGGNFSARVGGSTTGVTEVANRVATNTAARLKAWVKENVSAGSTLVEIFDPGLNAFSGQLCAVEITDAPASSVLDVMSDFEGNAGIDTVAHAAASGGVTIAAGSTVFAWYAMDRTSTRSGPTGYTVDTVAADTAAYPWLAHKTFASGGFGQATYHSDVHAAWIDPRNPEWMVIGTDGGVYVSQNRAATWRARARAA